MAVDDELVRAARAVRELAYAPYSGFRVGAAVRGADGAVLTGCNVENASFGLTLCAERVAVGAAVAAGAGRITAAAVVGSGADPVVPCGACLQVLWELGGPDCTLFLGGEGEAVRAARVRDLLPEAFEM